VIRRSAGSSLALVSLTTVLVLLPVRRVPGFDDIEDSDSSVVDHPDVFGISSGFVGGPHFIGYSGRGWFGASVDLNGLLTQSKDTRNRTHCLYLHFQLDTLFLRPFDYENGALSGIRPSLGIRVQTIYSNSQVLPFFLLRAGFIIWPHTGPQYNGKIIIGSTFAHFPVGGGIEVPKSSPVRFRFSLYYTIPYGIPYMELFGWLPIGFDVSLEINEPGRN
jgi:hypothetical protein